MTQNIIPTVIWAQRKDKIFVTFTVENTIDPKVIIESNLIKFESETKDKKSYKLDINLYNEINTEKSITNVKTRQVELILKKKEDDVTFWPQLTKEKQKYHWLKVDFDKWIDEDEEEEEMGDFDNGGGFNADMMSRLGGMGGMPGMGGMGGMGGMPGMGGLGDMDMGGLGDLDDEDDYEPRSDSDDENLEADTKLGESEKSAAATPATESK